MIESSWCLGKDCELLPFATAWMDPESIMLSEIKSDVNGQ